MSTRAWQWPPSIIPSARDRQKGEIYAAPSSPSLSTTVRPVSPTTNVISTAKPPSSTQPAEPDYLRLVLNARVYDVAVETPLVEAKNLSVKTKCQIFLKREDQQPVFSFKIRGAYNRMVQLTDEEKGRGVVCVSAGNHAQGVALAGKALGVKATIVMPTGSPEIKVNAVRKLGGTVVLYGNDFDEAKGECLRLAKEHQYTFIPPFDDPYIIAGQGTVGMEILRQVKGGKIDGIFVPVGGGGLLAGVAAYVKQLRPDIHVIGVNTVDSDGMTQSLLKGERSDVAKVGLFSDGTAVRCVGTETYRVCKQFVDDMVLCNTDEICAAIKDVFDDTRSVLEPSGALSVAGMKKYLANNPSIKDGVFVAVTSGANMNFDRLRFVAERARIGEGREALIVATVPEKKGSIFSNLCAAIQPRSVTEISYRYSNPKKAFVSLAFEVSRGKEETQEVISRLSQHDHIDALDITENEVAKNHVRFLAGGRANIAHERLYRFMFAERPGALRQFLGTFQEEWNMTLLHYRNQGGDVGRVLIGVQILPENHEKFESYLKSTGIIYVDETENDVYKFFLKE